MYAGFVPGVLYYTFSMVDVSGLCESQAPAS